MDPLEALRSAIAKKKKLEHTNGCIVIGTYAFPEDTMTCMKKLSATSKNGNNKESTYYNLKSLYFFWTVFSENEDTDIGTYIEKCASNGMESVSFPQKQALLDYFKGKEESCTYFDTKASFRYVKPQFANASGTTDDHQVPIGIGVYKRMRTIIGNEKIYKTRSKMISLEGSSSFSEAIDLLRRDEKKVVRRDEDWKGRMNVSDININLEEGFLTPATEQAEESYTREAIVIVPPSASGNVITMFNIEQFMNDGMYVPSDDIKKKSPLKPQEVVIQHSINNRNMKFRFIDNPSRLSKEDWHRVVCVMTGSQAWQFRGWSRMLGIFIWFNDSPVPPIVNGWNVKVVTINRDIRNMDSVASIQFWDLVEKEIKTKKVDLLKYNICDQTMNSFQISKTTISAYLL